jgi:hypothetical protein
MKKAYSVSLEKEKVEELQIYLDKFGITLSAFFDGIIDESIGVAKCVAYEMEDSKKSFRESRNKVSESMDLTANIF